MSKAPYISECKKIDSEGIPVSDKETLIRLLCSPQYYNEDMNIVNPDAFDLRILNSGDYECFVSLGRVNGFQSQDDVDWYLSSMGYKIWDDKCDSENHYYGYGTFECGDAREVHNMIEIHPLTGSKSHIGLFYRHPDGGFYSGPLPKSDPEILEMLSDLSDLLDVKKAPTRKS